MAWRKVETKNEDAKNLNELWISFGKEPKGDVNAKVLYEGDSIEKFKQPIVSLISGDVRYLMFTPKDLEKKIDSLIEEVDGKMVYTRITFTGIKELDENRKAYTFEVEYDDENILEE